MIAIANAIDQITVILGKVLACLMLPLVLFVFANAVLRYVFGIGHVWLFEIVGYCFAILAVGLAGWALKENEHVRVDIFYAMLSKRGKAVIDIFGTLFFFGLIGLAVGILSDLMYVFVDPRIDFEVRET